MRWFKRAWQGDERLWRVFWLYGILVGELIDVLGKKLFALLLPSIRLLPFHIPFSTALIVSVWIIFTLLYGVWISAALWKCSFNASHRFWGYAARFFFFFGLFDVFIDIARFSGDAGDDTSDADVSALIATLKSDQLTAPLACANTMAEQARIVNLDLMQYMQQHQEEYQKCMDSINHPSPGSN